MMAPVTDTSAILAALHSDAPVVRGGTYARVVAEALYVSGDEARRLVAGGAITINGIRTGDPEAARPDPIDGRWLLIGVGKRGRVIAQTREDA